MGERWSVRGDARGVSLVEPPPPLHPTAGPPLPGPAAMEHELLWDRIVKNERLLDTAAAIFGTDELVHLSTTVFTKPPHQPAQDEPPKRVGWHQDLLFWNLDPGRVLTAWVAIDDADVETGCLHVVPGTHAAGECMEHLTNYDPSNVLMAYQDIPAESFGGVAAAKALPLRAGQCSMHDGYTVHGSPPNTSTTRRRCGITVQIFPADVTVGPYLYDGTDTNPDTVTEGDWRKPIQIRGASRTDLPPAPF